jgi:hypothetical protein
VLRVFCGRQLIRQAVPVADIDSKIDALYKLPLSEFTGARNALAKTLSGDEAKAVKQLPKPTVVPWVVNQLYWHARPLYDRLLKAGAALREAQISNLKGRAGDVRKASDAHRAAIAEAVTRATEIAAGAGSKPAPDELARTLESISLAGKHPERPGRLTEPVKPAGFEALLGVTPAVGPRPVAAPATRPAKTERPPSAAEQKEARELARAAAAAERRRQEEIAARLKAAQAEVAAAEKALDRAQASEAKARKALDEAREVTQAAERALFEARQQARKSPK